MQALLGIFLLWCSLSLLACQNKAKRAYERALEQGVLLQPNDTVTAQVGERLLFVYHFADGVQPIHYTLDWRNSNPKALQYHSNPEFHLAPPDMAGGPAVGMHIFTTEASGLVELVFYNPHYNQKYYQQASAATTYDLWQTLAGALGTPDPDFTADDWDTWFYDQQMAASKAEENQLWQQLYATVQPTPTTASDSLWATLLPLVVATDPDWGPVMIDSMLQQHRPEQALPWREQWAKYWATLPLHPALETQVCYVQIQ